MKSMAISPCREAIEKYQVIYVKEACSYILTFTSVILEELFSDSQVV